MTQPDAAPSPSEALLARLLFELDQTPEGDRPAVVDRYLRDHPAQAAAIRELIDVEAGVRSPAADSHLSPPRLQSGQRLGPFRVVRFVAQGGMGEVYEAVQDVLDRRVALKVIRRAFVSPLARARFLREQRVLARLHQTNIVPVLHAGEEDDLQYCAMQFLDGVSVHRVVTELYRRETSDAGRRHTPPIREVVGSLVRADTRPPSDAPTGPAVSEAAPPAVLPAPLTLSPGYFASVAGAMVQVAEAVQHGHDRHVCHRDIKPSNLIIDADERCWVIDYGLAAAVNGAPGVGPPAGGDAEGKLTQGPLGTPQYMAPEQFDGRADPRSDVWGLGVTLYELLTLRPAFTGGAWSAVRDRVLRDAPPAPRKLVRNVPADLAAVCRKAMAKDPAGRYSTARAFAADLRRWLNWEPTAARPGWGTLRPLRLWAWRNKAWAVATALVLVTLIGGLAYESARAARLEREQAVLKAQQLSLGERHAGWSHEAMALLESAHKIRPGDDLRDHAAATLAGLDAREVILHYQVRKPRPDAIAGLSDITFGPDGKRILAGGYELCPALLWDDNLVRAPFESKRPGGGPVAFADADTPLQLVLPAGGRGNLTLWNVAKNEKVADLPLPRPGVEVTAVAVSADARFAAASATGPPDASGKRASAAAVWAIEPKKPGAAVKELARWDQPASALAFSPDGKYLAAGTRDGSVGVRATADGKEVLTLGGELPVNALAFGRNFRKTARDKPRLIPGGVPGWLLAVGTRGGTTAVWDLETRATVTILRGASHYINAVAFRPDGTAVVTTGHLRPIVWDVATGKALLHLPSHGVFQTGVAISPDGNRVAVTCAAALGDPNGEQAGLDLYDLDDGRGIRTYRGLAGPVEFVRLSPSRRWVAALSHNWELAVWDRATGRLGYVWGVPGGYSADNADLAFDEKEECVLFTSGERAVRLVLSTGERTGSWSLPNGLMDNLVLRPGQPPLVLRWERRDPADPGSGRALARELLDDGTTRAVLDPLPIPGPRGSRIHTAMVFAGGRYLVVYPPGGGRDLYTFDGKAMKPVPLPRTGPLEKPHPHYVTEDGKRLVINGGWKEKASCVYSLPDMALLAVHRGTQLSAIDDAGKVGTAFRDGLSLFRVGEERPLVTFDVGRPASSRSHVLSGGGRYVYWGRYDGTVCVADANQCLQQLTPFLGR